jgi:hypothetical protein
MAGRVVNRARKKTPGMARHSFNRYWGVWLALRGFG